MKKKINVKSLVIFGVLAVVMVLVVLAVSQVTTLMSGAASDVEPQSVTAVSGDDGKSAVISWISDKESISKIEYGTTAASLVLMSAETSAVTNHSLSLTSLRPSTTYYFRIRVGDEVFDNGGIPYTFKTKADTSLVVTVTPTVAAVNNASSSGITNCDPAVDYNKDGVVNSMDLATCKSQGGVVPTVGTTTTAVDSCIGNIADYNSDGVVNGLDRVNCLQSQR
jgi:hypothetical protein